jgi:hypothetical protein
MLTQNQYQNSMQKEFINLFHELGLPLYFNQKGNKQFSNYQRYTLIILYQRSKKSLRDFSSELKESRWISWLGLKKVPKKSTLHDWLKLFGMKVLRLMNSLVKPKNSKLTAIDGSGVDSWQRSRHYQKRINDPPMPYAKIDLFIDVKKQMIIDFSIIAHREHDAKSATKIFKRNNLRELIILADRGYDSEPLHELVRKVFLFYFAPVRRSSRKRPNGRYRKLCVELPKFMGQRSIVETIFSVLKRTQIISLRSKKNHMKKKEFAWHVILYNIRRKIALNSDGETQSIIFLVIWFWVIPDRA